MTCTRATAHTWIECFTAQWRRPPVLISFVALLLLATPSRGSPQVLQSFEELALRVNLDDQLKVEDESGVKVVGRLTHLRRDEFTIRTDAGEKPFTSDAVRAVAVRGHAFRKGALVGAGVFAVLGAVATCSHEGGGDCLIIGTLGAAPVGAGVGLAMAALIPSMRTVYRAPVSRAFAPRSATATGVQASLLEDVALRVNLDDQLWIEDESGRSATGRLLRLTADEITIHTGVGDTRFTRETVRQIALRHRPIRAAVLVGAGAGAVMGAVAACTGPTREECADAPILGGAIGAGLGLAAGALVRRTTIVYPETETLTLVSPLIARDTFGVQVSRYWSRR